MVSKYDRYNKNGHELCNAFGCRKHTKLVEYGKGKWCPAHLTEIKNLRQIINLHDGSEEEYSYRLEELRLRKDSDSSHYWFTRELEKNYLTHL